MADKQASTVLTVQVGGASVDIDSIAKAKKAIKDLNSEVLKGNKEALKSLADVKDRLEDVKEATETVKGSGVEKLTSSFSLLSQGFTSFDADKVKQGFAGIGSAMGAIPIFLLIPAITLLIENFDKLTSGSGALSKFLKGVSDVVKILTEDFTDFIGLTSAAGRELDKLSEAATKNANILSGALEAQIAGFDRQIAVAKSSAQQTVDLEIEKQKAIIATSTYINLSLQSSLKSNQKLTDEQLALYEKNRIAVLNAEAQINIITNTAYAERQKKREEDYKNQLAQQKAANEELIKENKRVFDEFAKVEALGDEFRKQLIEDQKALDQSRIDSNDLFNQLSAQQDATAQRSRDENLTKAKEKDAIERQIQDNFFNAARGLSDAFFAGQLNAAQGNEQKRNEILKKQFAVEKAFNIARATIDGIRSVQSALTIPPPLGNILAVSNALLAAANVAKIAAVKFQGASDSGASSGGGGTVSSPTIAATPAAPQLNTGTGGTTSTIINNNGSNEPLQAYVVEGQSRAVTERINRIRKSATFG
jgi:hypothetical protein